MACALAVFVPLMKSLFGRVPTMPRVPIFSLPLPCGGWKTPPWKAPRTMSDEEQYLCVGICMADPDSGYCLGCGRPPFESPGIVAEVVNIQTPNNSTSQDPDHPE